MASAYVCTRCSDNFVVNSKLISCKICENKFHSVCVKLKDAIYKAINDCVNIIWFCDECIQVVDEKLNVSRQIKSFEEKTSRLLVETKQTLENLKSSGVSDSSSTSIKWSDVVKRNNPPLIVKPKDKQQNSSVTKNDIAQKINPVDIAVAVTKIKPLKNQGTVIIECEDKESREKLQNTVVNELANKYYVETPKLLKPKLLIVGVNEQHVNDVPDFINSIKKQNFSEEHKNVEISVVRKYVPKNKKHYNVIIEVSPELYSYLINKGRRRRVEEEELAGRVSQYMSI